MSADLEPFVRFRLKSGDVLFERDYDFDRRVYTVILGLLCAVLLTLVAQTIVGVVRGTGGIVAATQAVVLCAATAMFYNVHAHMHLSP